MLDTLNPHLLADARAVAQGVLDHGDLLEDVYPIPVGKQFLYLSADRAKIVGIDKVDVGGVAFYLGFRRSDVT